MPAQGVREQCGSLSSRALYIKRLMFKTIDRDGSGALSKKELSAWMNDVGIVDPVEEIATATMINSLLKKHDTDKNMQLDEAEFVATVLDDMIDRFVRTA